MDVCFPGVSNVGSVPCDEMKWGRWQHCYWWPLM